MTSNAPEKLFTFLTGIDSFGDGTTLIYNGDAMFSRLESDESSTGYAQALSDLGLKMQSVDIEAEDWRVAEQWGGDANTDSLSELLESAKSEGFEVRGIGETND